MLRKVALAGVLGAAASPFLANWFLIPPYHTLRISDPENLLELVVLVSVAVIVSGFVSVAARRAEEAAKRFESAESQAAEAAKFDLIFLADGAGVGERNIKALSRVDEWSIGFEPITRPTP